MGRVASSVSRWNPEFDRNVDKGRGGREVIICSIRPPTSGSSFPFFSRESWRIKIGWRSLKGKFVGFDRGWKLKKRRCFEKFDEIWWESLVSINYADRMKRTSNFAGEIDGGIVWSNAWISPRELKFLYPSFFHGVFSRKKKYSIIKSLE